MGGTFDHLHSGHKLLLTMALAHTDTRLIIGITSQEMLSKKLHFDLIESFETRKSKVAAFCNKISPGVTVDIH